MKDAKLNPPPRYDDVYFEGLAAIEAHDREHGYPQPVAAAPALPETQTAICRFDDAPIYRRDDGEWLHYSNFKGDLFHEPEPKAALPEPTPMQLAELRADMERAAYEADCSDRGVIAEAALPEVAPEDDKWSEVYHQCSQFLLNPGEPSTKPIEWCIQLIEELRDMQDSLAAAKGGWIDVLDKLPGDRDPVLVWAEYWSAYPFLAHLNHGLWIGECILSEPANVTHWQPLPTPPDNKGDGK